MLRAYRTYDSMPPDRRFNFARERFLGAKTLQAVGALKRQLLEALSRAGVVRPGLKAGAIEALGRRAGGDGVRHAPPLTCPPSPSTAALPSPRLPALAFYCCTPLTSP